MLVVGLIDIQHMQSVMKVLFCFVFSKIATILVIWKPSDCETLCLSSTVIRGGKSEYWRKKSQLCFRANLSLQELYVSQRCGYCRRGKKIPIQSGNVHLLTLPILIIEIKQNSIRITLRGVQGCTSTDFRLK